LWTFYPKKYKFFSLEFEVSSDFDRVERTCYDLILMLGDIGGILSILLSAAHVLVNNMESLTIFAIFASKGYRFPIDPENSALPRNKK
jgi:hypothetical protein